MRAEAHDLKTFFSVVAKDLVEVRATDVLPFVTARQRARVRAENVARISDGGSGLSAATVRRRLAAVSAFYGYLIVRGDVGVETIRCLRRSEVLGLRLEELRLGDWRVFMADGKGGHERLVSLSTSFFSTAAAHMDTERPAGAGTDRVFVVLKGANRVGRCRPRVSMRSSAQPGPEPGSLMGTVTSCATPVSPRLCEHGMSLEALQAQAGQRSIASTQLDLQDCENALDGARSVQMGCMMAIRNIKTHSVDQQPDEQVVLEQLAALSVMARWIEDAFIEAA